MKKTILIFSALLLLLLFAESAIACSCMAGETVCDAYQRASVIFVGTVLSDTTVKAQMEVDSPGKGKKIETYSEKLFQFTVEQSFKGIEVTGVEVQTGMGGGDCGVGFKKGERYLVYASINKKTKKLHTSICSRTNTFSSAGEDLDFLRGLPDSATKTRISGTVIQFTNERNKSGYQKSQPMGRVKVVLHGEKTTFESFTNDEGLYLFVDLPPGKYKVQAELSATLSSKESEINLPVAGCAKLDIYTRTDGRIAGKVVDTQGQVVEGAKVKLLSADLAKNESSASTDKEGRYEFKELTPGKYYLGINLNQEPRGEFPYPRTFYPGTPDKDKAVVIVLADGEKLAGYDLALPPALSVKPIEGIFQWSDGRPVSIGTVSLTSSSGPKKKGRVYAYEKVSAQGQFVLQGFDGIEGWLHGSTYSTVGGRMTFVDIEPIKILVADGMKPIKLIALVPNVKLKKEQ